MGMNAQRNAHLRPAGPRPLGRSPIISGLLLGLLLTLFMVVFVYVAALFLSLGQQAIAEGPIQAPLALPQLVRVAPAANQRESTAGGVAVAQPARGGRKNPRRS